MNTRKNSHEKSILYLTPEDDVEKRILKEAWVSGVLKLHVTSFAGGRVELGVSLKNAKEYEEDD